MNKKYLMIAICILACICFAVVSYRYFLQSKTLFGIVFAVLALIQAGNAILNIVNSIKGK